MNDIMVQLTLDLIRRLTLFSRHATFKVKTTTKKKTADGVDVT